MSDTPRTDAAMLRADDIEIGGTFDAVDAQVSRQLERELDEALEWKHYLSSWGGTPEIVYSFIIGQQARIYAAQEVEKHLAAVTDQRDSAITALEKIASLDFVITLPDRMDAVRDIANEALNKIQL